MLFNIRAFAHKDILLTSTHCNVEMYYPAGSFNVINNEGMMIIYINDVLPSGKNKQYSYYQTPDGTWANTEDEEDTFKLELL